MSRLWTSINDLDPALAELAAVPPVPGAPRPALGGLVSEAAILEFGVLELLSRPPPASDLEDLGGVWSVDGSCAALCLPLLPRPNQLGKPCLKLKPPGGRRSSSVALTVPPSCMSVVYMYVERGVINGWNMSVEKVTSGGSAGKVSGKEM